MSDRSNFQRKQFDNLTYIPDGRDRLGFTNHPQRVSQISSNDPALILQAKDLNRQQKHFNTSYLYKPGNESIYAYSNSAFSDITGSDSRGPSIRSQILNYYPSTKFSQNDGFFNRVRGVLSKYWYVVLIFILIILIVVGVTIGVLVSKSKDQTLQCIHSCKPSEKLVQINETHCDCQFINECELERTICYPFSCVKLNDVGYECKCTTGFQHPPLNNDLTICEDINECLTPNICGYHQLCNNTFGSYNCYCQNGYETISTPTGITCLDKDECLDRNRCTNGQCINTNGSFTCICNPGFIKDILHPLFCEDIDECLLTHPCTAENEICYNTIGSFQCLCASGFQRNEQNQCININECSLSNIVCDRNSRCEDRNGTYACCVSSVTDRCIECGFEYGGTRRKRMINGFPVDQGQFPWVGALFIKSSFYNHEPRYVCGASLVSSWNLITAAHCLDEQHFRKNWDLTSEPSSFKDIFEIRIGVYNISLNSNELIQSRSYSINSFTLHSEYRSLANEDAIVTNDIAVIRLNERVDRSPSQDWICLTKSIELPDKTLLKIISYDRFIDDHSVQTQMDVRVLKSVNTERECQQQLNNLAEDAFCTLSTNSSTFLGVGDSGAGAMLSLDGHQWHLTGIMSKRGLHHQTYSAMTNVSTHLDWLKTLVER